MLLCLHNTLHLQRFLVPNPTVVDLLQRSIVGPVATACSPVKDVHQHHDTLTDIHTYICTHCVIASPLHQHASTLLAWTPCYCTRCRDPMYPCMPCWSICNRPESPIYEMPAPYKLAFTHRHETHWRRQASVDSLLLVHRSREDCQKLASLLVFLTLVHSGSQVYHSKKNSTRFASATWSVSPS